MEQHVFEGKAPKRSTQQVELFKRQYLQMLLPAQLTWPHQTTLKDTTVQEQLYSELFDEVSSGRPLPPKRYRYQVLKQLLQLIENGIDHPDEDVSHHYY